MAETTLGNYWTLMLSSSSILVITPWESVTPKVSSLTLGRALPKVGPTTGVKS